MGGRGGVSRGRQRVLCYRDPSDGSLVYLVTGRRKHSLPSSLEHHFTELAQLRGGEEGGGDNSTGNDDGVGRPTISANSLVTEVLSALQTDAARQGTIGVVGEESGSSAETDNAASPTTATRARFLVIRVGELGGVNHVMALHNPMAYKIACDKNGGPCGGGGRKPAASEAAPKSSPAASKDVVNPYAKAYIRPSGGEGGEGSSRKRPDVSMGGGAPSPLNTTKKFASASKGPTPSPITLLLPSPRDDAVAPTVVVPSSQVASMGVEGGPSS